MIKKLFEVNGIISRGTCKCCKKNGVAGTTRYRINGTTFGICAECSTKSPVKAFNEAHGHGDGVTVDAVTTYDHLVQVVVENIESVVALSIRFPECDFRIQSRNQHGFMLVSSVTAKSCYAPAKLFNLAGVTVKIDGKKCGTIEEYHEIVKHF